MYCKNNPTKKIRFKSRWEQSRPHHAYFYGVQQASSAEGITDKKMQLDYAITTSRERFRSAFTGQSSPHFPDYFEAILCLLSNIENIRLNWRTVSRFIARTKKAVVNTRWMGQALLRRFRQSGRLYWRLTCAAVFQKYTHVRRCIGERTENTHSRAKLTWR